MIHGMSVSYTHLDVYKRQEYYVTDMPDGFSKSAEAFLGEEISGQVRRVTLDSLNEK